MPLFRFRILGLLVATLLLPCLAVAQSDVMPYAVEQLKTNGSQSFAKLLPPDDIEESRRLAAALDKLRFHAGNLMDWEVIDSRPLSTRLTRQIMVLHYEAFPIFLRIDVYDSAHDTLYLSPKLSREIEDLLPFGSENLPVRQLSNR
ncbi:hypothetical protein [Actomonas aquatica]|uniref:Uncharacterized protein n=1 Tax=Actomonas aquatica TaxID=2866162 RepID=A0ABZ1CAY7_9BACT|nr:hypothetical protein [Opitutus sp. WL0086]WRQ88388.1 hypothetical protein K1X11_003165 [Opitutus sp. WL0086]